jgi:hypothetical protein
MSIRVIKVKSDKYNGFKVPNKTDTCTKWAIHIYNIIKEAKIELLSNILVKDAYNNLIVCLNKYKDTLESWIPAKYDKYTVGIKYDSYKRMPFRWNYTFKEQDDPIISAHIKDNTLDIITTYMILYELIKRDVVPYMEQKEHDINNKKDIECYHRCIEKLERDIIIFENRIKSHRRSINTYVNTCIALQTPPSITNFD